MSRLNEWYVPRWGNEKVRALIGMTFWPYSLMCVSFTIMGSMLAPVIYWDRVLVIAVIYALALGISAHALDARYSKTVKPWGQILSDRQLEALIFYPLVPVLGLGSYIMQYSPLILIIGLAEFFFLFTYNMESFSGKFHTDAWFAFSWGTLPLLAGSIAQTNWLPITAVPFGVVAFLLSYVEINASRPYKEIRRNGYTISVTNPVSSEFARFGAKYENILKGVVALTLMITLSLLVTRLL